MATRVEVAGGTVTNVVTRFKGLIKKTSLDGASKIYGISSDIESLRKAHKRFGDDLFSKEKRLLQNFKKGREKAWLAIAAFFALYIRFVIFSGGRSPPGDDPAMASGFIYLIMTQGKIPLVNVHHMPDTPYTYPPLFHLLGSNLAFVTGLPVITTVFVLGLLVNSLTVLPIFCFTRRFWNKTAAILASFIFVVSSPDLFMLLWGGHVNVTTLFFFPLIFWFMLKRDYLGVRDVGVLGILICTLPLSHQLSAFVYMFIVALCLAIMLVRKSREGFEKRESVFMKKLVFSVIIGLTISSLWYVPRLGQYFQLFEAGEAYRESIKSRMLSIKGVSTIAQPMFFIVWLVPLGLLFLRREWGLRDPKFTVLGSWMIAPLILTQSWAIGLAVDYERFFYYIIYPLIVLIAIGIIAVKVKAERLKIKKRHLSAKGACICLGILMAAYVAYTVIYPFKSIASVYSKFEVVSLYDYFYTARGPEVAAINWIMQNTQPDDLIVADHSFGWWIAGIAHRPTLSATPLPFLSYASEIPLARTADFILDGGYDIENGILRVRDTGPFFAFHNPIFSIIRRGVYVPVMFMADNESYVTRYKPENLEYDPSLTLEDFCCKKISWLERGDDQAILLITYMEEDLVLEKKITVERYNDSVTVEFDIKTDGRTKVLELFLRVHLPWEAETRTFGEGVSFNDNARKIYGNITFSEGIFEKGYPKVPRQPLYVVDFMLRAQNDTYLKASLHLRLQDVEKKSSEEEAIALERLMKINVISLDLLEEIKSSNIKYIVAKGELARKFMDYSLFNLVFVSGHVHIFRVEKAH